MRSRPRKIDGAASPTGAGRLLAALTLAGGFLGVSPSAGSAQVMDDRLFTYVAFDELEYVPTGTGRPVAYDGEGWIGGDFNRLWLRARGEAPTLGGDGELEAQALYSRTVSAYWNAQAGVRIDHHYGEGSSDTRTLMALGIEGLSPYWFEVESFLFVSHRGDISARLEARYELLLTQRLILEPDLELNVAVQRVSDFGVGSGLNDLELGGRLRYEIVREAAPYLGISWLGRAGETADLAREREGAVSEAVIVAGLRWWY